MTGQQPSRAVLLAAAVVVVVSLAALVVVPLLMTESIERYRLDVEDHADPARAALNEVGYRLSHQIASLTRAAATRDSAHIAAYRGAVSPQEAAMRSLREHSGTLGPEYDEALTELQRRMALWHASVEQSVDAQRLVFDANYPAVIDAARRIDEAITGFQAGRRDRVRRLTRIQLWLTAGLVLLATAAASIVVWMVSRLRAQATMLAELIRVRDEILGVVSHDLRSPLTTIALSSQLIPGSPAGEQDEHVQTIVNTTRRMERLIEDLLDVTRVENGRLSIRRDTVDPAAIAQEVIASHAPIAASKNVDLQALINGPLPEIRGDEDRLAQALTNLIGNAFKFTPPGGQVRLFVERRDGNVRFEVADSGPGIAPGDFPHLFEPFWQAKKTAHLGAGLGLKITRAIVEAHDGSIAVRNRPEGGASFSFELPAA